MPEVHNEHKAVLVGVVLSRVSERGVEDNGAVLYPISGLTRASDVAILWHAEAEVSGEEKVSAVAVRRHAGARCLPCNDDAAHGQRHLAILQELHCPRELITVLPNPIAKALQAEAGPAAAHHIVLHAVGDECLLFLLEKICKFALYVGQALNHLLNPLPAFLWLPPRLGSEAREELGIHLLELGQGWDGILVLAVLDELEDPLQGLLPKLGDDIFLQVLFQHLPELFLPLGQLLLRCHRLCTAAHH
mmetsp:Transcript_108585/g.231920  ORF Transcript_108585/g.231920 Transcript_108585/m.231920 type:complete len:247 (+) Transcript_108585:288-1028(+)